MDGKKDRLKLCFKNKMTVLLTAVSLFSGFGGCDNYGKLQRDQSLTKAFQNNQMDDTLAYYFFGRDNMPYAIAGIDPRYTLTTKFWEPVEPKTERFKKMIYWIWTDHNYEPHGAYVIGPNGEKVGIFYSSIDRVVIRIDKTNKTVSLIADTPYLRDGP
jgi:hypothetical protein